MNKESKIFKSFLKTEGLRITTARMAIVAKVSSIGRHFNADDLVYELRHEKTPIARATVYRTLDHLVRSGLVKKLDISDNRATYEHIYGHKHHDHMICNHCGKVIEFFSEDIEKLQDKICSEYKFKPDDHSLKIYGLCADCNEENNL